MRCLQLAKTEQEIHRCVVLLKKEISFWFESAITNITLDDLFDDVDVKDYERTVVAAELRKLAAMSPPLIIIDPLDPERFNRPPSQ